MAVVTTTLGLPAAASRRYRAQSLTCAFQAISRTVFRRAKLTPRFSVGSAARFGAKRVVGDACCGDDRSNTARASGQREVIKEIARALHLSRNTVRRILRQGETAFSYEREVQPRPKLGPWTGALDRLLAANAKAPAREKLTLDPRLRGAAGARLRGRLRRGSALCAALGRATCEHDGRSLYAADLYARRSLSVCLHLC